MTVEFDMPILRLVGAFLHEGGAVRQLHRRHQRVVNAHPMIGAYQHALAPHARAIVDKMPDNARYLGFIATLLPGARVILCRRDPRDIGLPIYQHRFFGYHPLMPMTSVISAGDARPA